MQITQTVRLRWKSLVPLLGVIGVWLASPEVLRLVNEKWSHALIAVSSLIAVLTPALLTNKPKTPRKPKKSTTPPSAPNDASADFTRGE